MPCDYSKYPSNWKEIRARILERAGHKCERCGVKNYVVGARDKNGDWHDESSIHSMNSECGRYLFGQFPKMTKIVLTIAHVGETKHDKMDCRDEVLLALCQRCHLAEDMDDHMRNAAETRRHKRVLAAKERGQTFLFEEVTN